jgi:hypothetical protein
MRLTDEQIAAIRDGTEGVTPGPWEADTTKSDGCYGSGEDCHEGYQTSVLLDAKGERIADALNSDCGQVSEEYDEDGCYAWDEVAKRNFAYIARCDPDTIRALATEVLESRAAIAAKDVTIDWLTTDRGAALAAKRAEIERLTRLLTAATSRLSEYNIDRMKAEARVAELEADSIRMREALILIRREQQSEAQAGTGDYQRGYDDCIAAHAEIARAALGRDAT